MKVKFSDLPILSCFMGKNGEMKKKVAERKAATVGENDRRVRTRKVKGNPEVDECACSIGLFGVGLRRHPDMIVEIGDGNTMKRKNKAR